jgi:hypothetical protein
MPDCTVDVCSVFKSTVFADVYSRYVQCVTIHSMCLMCTVDVCSVLQCTVYAR